MNIPPNFKSLHIGQLNFLNNLNHFSSRLTTLSAELEEQNFDVVCFQEILEEAREDLEEVMERLGFVSSAYGPTVENRHGSKNGNAIFTKIVPTWYDFIEFQFDDEIPGTHTFIPVVVAKMAIDGQLVFVLSAHLAWGGTSEQARLRQVTVLNEKAEAIVSEHPDAIIVLTGDFNAVEESSTIRYLTGKQENHESKSTYWVDAYQLHGHEGNWATSNPQAFWGRNTAHSVGIKYPEMVPQRRIDYIFSYGWCYGKPGVPLTFDVFGNSLTGDETELSDHYGLSSRILL